MKKYTLTVYCDKDCCCIWMEVLNCGRWSVVGRGDARREGGRNACVMLPHTFYNWYTDYNKVHA